MNAMSRNHLHRALVTAAAMLIATGVAAWPTVASADKAAEKPAVDAKPKTEGHAGLPGKPDDAKKHGTSSKTDEKASDVKEAAKDAIGTLKGKNDPAAREARRNTQREQLRTSIKGPMTESMKQEIRRHAQRVARIERIKALAIEAKDKEVTERADKLLAKENARHDKWVSNAGKQTGQPSKAAEPATAAAGTPAAAAKPAEPNAKVDVKGGSK